MSCYAWIPLASLPSSLVHFLWPQAHHFYQIPTASQVLEELFEESIIFLVSTVYNIFPAAFSL